MNPAFPPHGIRRSIRAFLPDPVAPELLRHAVRAAAEAAPSSGNMQPWHLYPVVGARLEALRGALLATADSGAPQHQEVASYPDAPVEPYHERRRACGFSLYAALGIARDDRPGRQQQWRDNFTLFGAPALVLTVDARLPDGGLFDSGTFLHALLDALWRAGLGSCPQASVAAYPEVLRGQLGIPETQRVVCSVAVGWADVEAPVNRFKPDRAPLEQWYHEG